MPGRREPKPNRAPRARPRNRLNGFQLSMSCALDGRKWLQPQLMVRNRLGEQIVQHYRAKVQAPGRKILILHQTDRLRTAIEDALAACPDRD
jgi:hypothetical protein